MLEFRNFKIVGSCRGTQLNNGIRTTHGEQEELSFGLFCGYRELYLTRVLCQHWFRPGPKSGEAKSKRPVICPGAPHLRKNKLLLKSP